MKKEVKQFQTLDLYLSAWLTLHNITPSYEVINNKVVFNFTADDQLYRLTQEYNKNQQVPVLDFVNAIKVARAQIMSRKDTIWHSKEGKK